MMYACYVNKKSYKRICYQNNLQDPMLRSLRLLRNKLKKQNFNNFIVLTYSDTTVQNASSKDPRAFFNNLKQYFRNREKSWIKKFYGNDVCPFRHKNIVNLNYYDMALKFEKFRKKLRFSWKVEYGELKGRIHIHVLLKTNFKLTQYRIWKIWKKGDINRDFIKNNKKSKLYVAKYFRKPLTEKSKFVRIFGTSRNIKKSISEWSFKGIKDEMEMLMFMYFSGIDRFRLDDIKLRSDQMIMACINYLIQWNFIKKINIEIKGQWIPIPEFRVLWYRYLKKYVTLKGFYAIYLKSLNV